MAENRRTDACTASCVPGRPVFSIHLFGITLFPSHDSVVGIAARAFVGCFVGGILVVLTRPVGIFCLVPLIWHLWRNHVPRAAMVVRDRPPSEWVTYFLLMKALTGNQREGFDAQRFWDTHSAANILNISKFLDELIHPAQWHDYRRSSLDRAFVDSLSPVSQSSGSWIIPYFGGRRVRVCFRL